MGVNPTLAGITPYAVVAMKLSLGPLAAGPWMVGLYLPFPLPGFRRWRGAWRWLVGGGVLLSVDGVALDRDHGPLLDRGEAIRVGERFHLRVLRDGATIDVEAPAVVPRFAREQLPFALVGLVVLGLGVVLLFAVPPGIKALSVLLLVPYLGGIMTTMGVNPTFRGITHFAVACLIASMGPLVAGAWLVGLYVPFGLPNYRRWRGAWRWALGVGALIGAFMVLESGSLFRVRPVGLVMGYGLAVLGVAFAAATMVWRLRLRPPPSVRRQLRWLLWGLASSTVGGTCLLLTNGAFYLAPRGWDFWFFLAGAILIVPVFPAMLALCFDVSVRSLRRLLARFTLWVTVGVVVLVASLVLWALGPAMTGGALGVAPLLGAGVAAMALIALWHRWLGGILERRLVRQEPDAREREQALTGLVLLLGRSGLERTASELAARIRELLGCRWVHLYAPAPSGGPLPWVPLATAETPRRGAAAPVEPPPSFESAEAMDQALGGDATRFVVPLRGPDGSLAALAGELDASVRRFPTLHPDERSALELFAGRAGATLAMQERSRRVGPYRLTHHLASGGMGEVYVAEDTRLDAAHPVVVLKRLLPALVGSEAHVERFLAEAEVAKSLDHPGIVETYEAGRDADGLLYIAMEYVQGGDARDLLSHCRATGGPLEAGLAFAIGARLCEALAYAHGTASGPRRAKPLVHRDISPDNVLLSSSGTVRLADFGVALEVDPACDAGQAEMGKIPFMAPERIDGLGATPRSDLFSVGVLLYELLTLTHPFAQATRAATLEAIRLGRPIPLSALRDDVPPEPLDVVMAALRADPAARPSTAQAMATVLDRFAAPPADAEQRFVRLAIQLWGERGAATLSGTSTSGSHRHPQADTASPTLAIDPPRPG